MLRLTLPACVVLFARQVTLIIRLVEALLQDEGGRTPLHEVARRRCMQVRRHGPATAGLRLGGAVPGCCCSLLHVVERAASPGLPPGLLSLVLCRQGCCNM